MTTWRVRFTSWLAPGSQRRCYCQLLTRVALVEAPTTASAPYAKLAFRV